MGMERAGGEEGGEENGRDGEEREGLNFAPCVNSWGDHGHHYLFIIR